MQVIIRALLREMEEQGTLYLHHPVEAIVDLEDSLNPAVRLKGGLHFLREGRKLLISGTVRGPVELECGRCLERFSDRLEVRIEEECLLDDSLPPPEDPAEEMWSPEGQWVLPLDMMLDTDELVRQHALLSLPLRPLCRTECPGLAPPDAGPQAEEAQDPRWAILKDYRRRLEERSN